MSELTEELRDEAEGARAFGEHGHAALLDLAADRLDALEECLREFLYCSDNFTTVSLQRMADCLDKARALLEGK